MGEATMNDWTKEDMSELVQAVARAMRTGRGTNAALAEIGDAGAVLALAAWRVVK